MTRETERMSAVDAAWLRMDRPTNLMMIVGVVVFDSRVDFRRFRARSRSASSRSRVPLPRAAGRESPRTGNRTRTSTSTGTSCASRCPHPPARPSSRPSSRSSRAPTSTAPAALAVPFRRALPGRQRRDPAHPPLLCRRHGDDPRVPDAHRRRGESGRRDADRAAGSRAKPSDGDDRRPGSVGSTCPGADLLRQAYAEGAHCWRGRSISRNPEQADEIARHALGIAGELARVATLADDPPTRFKGPLGTRKIAAWTDPLPLAEVKAVAKALGCTINDLLMSTAAGALGGYLRQHGEDTDGMTIRAAVPVNLRDPATAAALGNYFGLVFLELPIGIRDPLERLFEVHAAMSR